jgi:hypothetical protein
MIQNTIGILQRAADLGIKLAFEPPNTLTYEPIERCPPAFVDTLKDHKWLLLDLLRLPFLMLYSKTLEETIFFCQDEATKADLVQAGADEFAIYTKDELRILVAQNRVAPISADELRKVHEIKKTFNARITPL